ncbi:MAG: SOS response-associated peptidase [Oscillospiraceae bacterium]|nr:SOS response-associated peptidase [Oscillospiraceae bacterium]
MCTRYFIERNSEQIAPYILRARDSVLYGSFLRIGKEMATEGEIRPTDVVPVLASNRRGEPSVFPMRWGYKEPERALLVNARAETASVKPTFRDGWRQHRCIVPASGYYEWEHFEDRDGNRKTGEKYAVRSEGDSAIWMCGLYRIRDGLPEFVILTKDANDVVRQIHDRMPLMLSREAAMKWIDPGSSPGQILPNALENVKMQQAQKG